MDREEVNQLMNKRFDHFLQNPGPPFTDPTIGYPGVYAAAFVHADGSPMTWRESVQITDILLSLYRMKSNLVYTSKTSLENIPRRRSPRKGVEEVGDRSMRRCGCSLI